MTRFTRWFQVVLATGLLGTVFQPGIGCLGSVARNFNPCGTILNCDPLEYDLSWYDPQKDFPDWGVDPTCTIPGLCQGNTPFPPAFATGSQSATVTPTTPTTGGGNLGGIGGNLGGGNLGGGTGGIGF